MATTNDSHSIPLFLSVCDLGSFARAAEHMALSPSTVAKAIARLESRLGVRLFERSTRRVVLTREGEYYRAACRRAFDELQRAESTLATVASEPAGLLKVSLPPLLGARVIAPSLYSLTDRFPDLSIDVSLTVGKVDLISERIDLAVRIGGLPDLAGLMTRRLGEQHVVLCASPDYLAGRRLPFSTDELRQHELVATVSRGEVVPWLVQADDGQVRPWIPPSKIRSDGSLLTLDAVRAGRGIGLLPRWLVSEDVAHGELVATDVREVGGHLPVSLLWTRGVTLPRVRVAMNAVAVAVAALDDL